MGDDSMSQKDRSEQNEQCSELQDAIAQMIAKARVGNSVYMDGSHNPRPSEDRMAGEIIALVREQVARELDTAYQMRNDHHLSEYDAGVLYGLDIAEQIARGELGAKP